MTKGSVLEGIRTWDLWMRKLYHYAIKEHVKRMQIQIRIITVTVMLVKNLVFCNISLEWYKNSALTFSWSGSTGHI